MRTVGIDAPGHPRKPPQLIQTPTAGIDGKSPRAVFGIRRYCSSRSFSVTPSEAWSVSGKSSGASKNRFPGDQSSTLSEFSS